MTLQADYTDGTYVVRDTDGGVWWPSDEALAEIQAADDPEAKAVEICDQQPMRGHWSA